MRSIDDWGGATALPEPPASIQSGGRNETVFRYLCSCRALGADDAAVEACAEAANARCEPPLPAWELAKLVRSACGYEAGERGGTTLPVARATMPSDYAPSVIDRVGDPSALPDLSRLEPQEQLRRWVEALFEPTDCVCVMRSVYGTVGDDGECRDLQFLYAGQLMDLSEGHPATDGTPQDGRAMRERVLRWCDRATGMWAVANPLDWDGRRDANVVAYRHTLVESDEMPLDEQLERMLALFDGRIAAIVESGGKSLHGIVRVGASDRAGYDRRVARIHADCEANGFRVDHACRNPARLTRLPGAMRCGRRQRLVAAWPRG